jgi:hypothetical protein
MRIVFTLHAEKKLQDLRRLGVQVSRYKIRNVLKEPVHLDNESDPPKTIASGKFGENHLLRGVFDNNSG